MILTMYEKWIMYVILLTHDNYSRMKITHAFILSKWFIVNICHKLSYGTHDVWKMNHVCYITQAC